MKFIKAIALKPPPPPAEYHVILTHDECVTLARLFGRVAGCGTTKVGTFASDLWDKMKDAGVTYNQCYNLREGETHRITIYDEEETR